MHGDGPGAGGAGRPGPGVADGLAGELTGLRGQVAWLRAENARLLRLLELTPQQAGPPGPAQTGFFERAPGPVHAGSTASAKVAFFRRLFAARTDVYALRWENARTNRSGWVPAVAGGWRKGSRRGRREYLPLTEEVVTAPVRGESHWAVSAVGPGRVLLAGGGLRRAGGDAGRPVVSGRWAEQIARCGYCARPVRLRGRVRHGKREVYSTDTAPDRVLFVRCRNRRASMCPSCSSSTPATCGSSSTPARRVAARSSPTPAARAPAGVRHPHRAGVRPGPHDPLGPTRPARGVPSLGRGPALPASAADLVRGGARRGRPAAWRAALPSPFPPPPCDRHRNLGRATRTSASPCQRR